MDAIRADLEKPDADIDQVWAKETRKRWAAYQADRAPTLSYKAVMAKYRRR
jgi:hypothetical protein